MSSLLLQEGGGSKNTTSLDSEKHSNGAPANTSLRRPSFLDSDDDGDGDGGEFGGASDNEAPDPHFLETLETQYELESEMSSPKPRPLQITSSQLQAHLPMGLDNEKHEDIAGLLLERGSISSSAAAAAARISKNTTKKGKHQQGHETTEDDSEDEFGDADDNDIPATQRLFESFNDDDEVHKKPRVTVSQLQAHIPAGLDNEKHEEISNLMLSRHAMGIREAKTTTASAATATASRKARSSFSSKSSDNGGVDDDDDEFGDADYNDTPVNQYLQDAEDLIKMEDDKTFSPPLRVTPSQLQARMAAGLDVQKHEEITNLVNSAHDRSTGLPENEEGEFGDADENDVPVKRFLGDSTHSVPFLDEDDALDGSDHQNEMKNNDKDDDDAIGGIDAGKHDALNELRVTRSNHNDDEGEEFGKANDSDRPVEQCIDRWKDSFNDDAEFDDIDEIEFIPLKGGYHSSSTGDNLDSEKHEDLGDFLVKSPNPSRYLVSDDDGEFEQAGEYDVSDQKYLKNQASTHSRGSVGSITLEDHVVPDLDHETHEDLGVLRENAVSVSDMSYGSSGFKSASTLDLPNSSFLKHQISIQDDEFLSVDEIREVEDEITSKGDA